MELKLERLQRCQLCGRVVGSDSEARQHLTEEHADNPTVQKALRAIRCDRSILYGLTILAICIIAFVFLIWLLYMLI